MANRRHLEGNGQEHPAAPDAVQDQLEHILASPSFANAPRLSRLLRYLVAHSAGGDREIQEYALGVEVFDRGASFDTHSDTIVRVHARRLRLRLGAYYAGPGAEDPIVIEVPKGRYRARFRLNVPPADTEVPARAPWRPAPVLAAVAMAGCLVAIALLWLAWRAPAADASRQAIAVLPFVSLSGHPENEQFSDGISAEVLNALARYPGLTVVARASSFALRSPEPDIARLSQLLGVNYLLQGSVRRQGQTLRITAQLVDRNGVQRWSDAYDRSLGDVFGIQRDIAAAVAANVAPRVAFVPATETPPDPQAYQHYLMGREILAKRLPSFPHQAIEQFAQALQIEPGYAEAHAEQAVALILGAHWWGGRGCCVGGSLDRPGQLERAQQSIEAALQLKPDLARAHAAQGLFLQMRDQPDHRQAESALRHARALDPNHVDTRNWLSRTLNEQGRHAEALAELEAAARLDPLAISVNLNVARGLAERGAFGEAEQRIRSLLQAPAAQPLPHLDLAELYTHTGRLAEANRSFKAAVLDYVQARHQIGLLEMLGAHYARLGLWEESRFWQSRSERNERDRHRAIARSVYPMQLEGRHHELLQRFRSYFATGVDPSELPAETAADYGILLALTGEHRAAIALLKPRANVEPLSLGRGRLHTQHALAWALNKVGAEDRARRLLDDIERDFAAQQRHGLLHRSEDLMMYAQNALLAGNIDAAYQRLDAAVEAGWGDYYAVVHDPRWQQVGHQPRFDALLARVKADLDVQRAQITAIDREDGFVTRLEAAARLYLPTAAH